MAVPIVGTGKPKLKILLATPRGFCAGVERAIAIVRSALAENGAPVYVRHEIVHNKHVVDELRDLGAIFVDELDEVPEHGMVVFSAHGVPKSVPDEAKRRKMVFVDATCPLVSKVHREVERHAREGRTVLLIGHTGHPEVVGTMGQVAEGSVILVETVNDAESVQICDPRRLAYATQTTLSVRDTRSIVSALRLRFPAIVGPRDEDICYATTNRQEAVGAIASRVDALIVVGAENSSNSKRLVEVARDSGCDDAHLVAGRNDFQLKWLKGVRTLGISAGASAPEILVSEIIELCREHFDIEVQDDPTKKENVYFRSPPIPRQRTTEQGTARLMPTLEA